MVGWEKLKGFPWDVKPREHTPTQKTLLSGEDAIRLRLPSLPIEAIPPQERKMYVTRADIEKFGPTDECPGCICLSAGVERTGPTTIDAG